ncbi:hypothetical protein HN858_02865 [Candidatus Falkowbacteria bacterium]|jgi:hypothetical protein|nr:hypothetical protein [Candidatus Falkowbacteria bacterium]MBT5503409.1 hypothetical protein [Candidatus Falkowbacteria bacterium]MBT6574028.1 hypothetical protein [Candidatus Falkowbacteria bacterium]MBT7348598.1 hypothetical protein [Candidatus Falkowbacteria bacterium]MBT7500388.1 hypothetical protein [Candidatus Falkowbacteria bacterium]
MLHFLEKFYQHTRNTLMWFIVYFVLQTVIWIALGVLVLVYPQTLFILFALFFVLIAAVNVYFAILFIHYFTKLKKLKDTLKIG